MEIVFAPFDEMAARLPHDAQVGHVAIVTRAGDGFEARVASVERQSLDRIRQSIEFLDDVIARMPAAYRAALLADRTREIVFQMSDEAADVPSIAFQALEGARDVRLVPDVCYYLARGYEGAFDDAPAWRDRRPLAVWRGASTGTLPSGRIGANIHTIDELPRYRLCREAARLGPVIDAKLYAIVQITPIEDHDPVVARCTQEGVMGAFLQPSEIANHQMLIDIDGNTNSWNAMARYRMGCCILKVESPWRQWFEPRFRAWEHYVPVHADFSDLGHRIDWCLRNPGEAEAIARRGRAEAVAMRFDDEMAMVGAKLLSL